MTFFTTLFNVKQTNLLTSYKSTEVIDDDISDDSEDIDNVYDTRSGFRRITRLKSAYQCMYYAVHNGRRKTPLHLMTAHAVCDVCKGRELITALNRIGTCVSYNEIKRARSTLAQYALHQREKEYPSLVILYLIPLQLQLLTPLTVVIDHPLQEQKVTTTQS